MVQTAGFDHIELTLTSSVLVTIPNLLEGVTTVRIQLRKFWVLLVKLSQCQPGSPNLGLGCHIPNLFMGFGDNMFPDRLYILPEDHNNVHYSLRGRSRSLVTREDLVYYLLGSWGAHLWVVTGKIQLGSTP